MRPLILAMFSVTLFAVQAFAQTAISDLSVEIASTSTSFLAGERATFTVRVRNLGIDTAETDNLRIEITPLTPGLRIWAFVALTNNDTQQVVTLTPQ